jgi:hypothetical protein
VYFRAIREESVSIRFPRGGSGGAGGDYTSYSGSSNVVGKYTVEGEKSFLEGQDLKS